LASPGGIPGEIVDLRNDTDEGFENSEGRVGFPELDWIDGTAPAAAGGDVVLRGRNLLQGQTFDGLSLNAGAAVLSVFALKPGDSGITVVVVAGVGALSVTFVPSTGVLTITLAAGGSTDAAIATAINANAAQTDGYIRATSGAAGSLTLAVASTPMTGGVGAYALNKVEVTGLEALPANEPGANATAKWANDVITATVPVLTGATPARAAADTAATRISSNGVQTDPIASVLG
jgi:hypothetical protein